ncbi:MAG: peptidoglycan recognition protein family protein [Planctomycetota bacterium]
MDSETRREFSSKVVLIFWGCLVFLGGCTQDDEGAPQITYDYSRHRRIPSSPPRPRRREEKVYSDVPEGWLPPSHLEKRWTAIVIHHSDTVTGSASIFDRYHRENKYWAGVGYDFVIGNGTDSGDGEVEVTFRWRQQRTGAHCKTPNNWANEDAVGICLVGDFNQSVPTSRQMWSLGKLVRFLQVRYRIPAGRVYSHKCTPGARPTDCPGRNFPMAKLKSMLDYRP